jgi:hypothetical protein
MIKSLEIEASRVKLANAYMLGTFRTTGSLGTASFGMG